MHTNTFKPKMQANRAKYLYSCLDITRTSGTELASYLNSAIQNWNSNLILLNSRGNVDVARYVAVPGILLNVAFITRLRENIA